MSQQVSILFDQHEGEDEDDAAADETENDADTEQYLAKDGKQRSSVPSLNNPGGRQPGHNVVCENCCALGQFVTLLSMQSPIKAQLLLHYK